MPSFCCPHDQMQIVPISFSMWLAETDHHPHTRLDQLRIVNRLPLFICANSHKQLAAFCVVIANRDLEPVAHILVI